MEICCIICQDTISNSWVYTNCLCIDNLYHIRCLSSWISNSNSCPTCRKAYNIDNSDSQANIQSNITLEQAIFLDSIGRYRSYL